MSVQEQLRAAEAYRVAIIAEHEAMCAFVEGWSMAEQPGNDGNDVERAMSVWSGTERGRRLRRNKEEAKRRLKEGSYE